MKAMDRSIFCRKHRKTGRTETTNRKQPSYCYLDCPQGIGFSATISAPHMHAMCLELMLEHLRRVGCKALDVGSGSGYLTASMAFVASSNASSTQRPSVVGVEHVAQLVEQAKDNCRQSAVAKQLLEDGVCSFVCADGRAGLAREAPFDVIHVGAATERVADALLDQLKPTGRLIVPVGPSTGVQRLVCYDKNEDGRCREKKVASVRFVPLTSRSRQCPAL